MIQEQVNYKDRRMILCKKEVRDKINALKSKWEFLNSSCVLEYLINLEAKLIKVIFTMSRDNVTMKFNGVIMLDKLKDGWEIKSIDWSELLKDGQVQN